MYFRCVKKDREHHSMTKYTTLAQKTRIGVITDLHYTHPSLIVEKGKALDNYLRQDRKLLLESDAILRQSVTQLLQENVDIVFIPGDLTKDGERVSHHGVARLLQPLRRQGIKVLVIPGNHDINNPDAVSFHGDITRREATVSVDDFETIYTDYGYGDAVSRDEHSLSYVSEPVEGFRVLCIDSNKYDENKFISNGDKADFCVTHGAIRPGTMAWIRNEMKVAKILNKQIVAMIHHNVVEHFTHQGLFAAPYMVDNFTEVQKKFLEYGISVLFTGHFHSSDIARVGDPSGKYLYEIETGSLVTYPCSYRIVEVAGRTLDIETRYIEEIDYPLPGGKSLQTHARHTIEHGINEMLAGFVSENHHTFADYLPVWTRSFITIPNVRTLIELLMLNLSTQAVDMMLAHYSGNEELVENAAEQKERLLAGLDNFIRALAKASAGKFAGIVEKFIQRMAVIKKAKEAVAGIWNNKAVHRHEEGFAYYSVAVNDLRLTIELNPVKEETQITEQAHFSFSLY